MLGLKSFPTTAVGHQWHRISREDQEGTIQTR
jgi:hypothetical protein